MIDNGIQWRIALTMVLLFLLIGGVFYILNPESFEKRISGRTSKVVYATPPRIEVTVDMKNSQSWKTYSNETYGYTIKYPSDLDIIINDTVQDITTTRSDGADGSITAIKAHISIGKSIAEFNQLYDAQTNTTFKRLSFDRIIKIKNVSISNHKAVSYIYETTSAEKKEVYRSYGTLIQKGNTVIDINSWSDDLSIYKAVLETLVVKK